MAPSLFPLCAAHPPCRYDNSIILTWGLSCTIAITVAASRRAIVTKPSNRSATKTSPWALLPILLCFFGSSCGLLSRMSIESEVTATWMLFAGVATVFVVGLPLCNEEIRIPSKTIGELQLIAISIVIMAVMFYLLFAPMMGFAFPYLMLAVGMGYQLGSWTMLCRRAKRLGIPPIRATLLGLSLCCAHSIMVEIEIRALRAIANTQSELITWGVVILFLSSLLILLYLFRYIFLNSNQNANAPAEPAFAGKMEHIAGEHIAAIANAHALTSRECDILLRLSARSSLTDIANECNLTVDTVKSHLSHIYRKLGVRNRQEALTLLEAAAPKEKGL